MKIAILQPSYEESNAPFRDLDPACDPSPYIPEMECRCFKIDKARAARQITAIAGAGFDVAINLCDGAWDEDRAGIEVVRTLEHLNIAFTGAGSSFYDPTREAMKMACHSAGVKFPAYVMARRADDARRAVSRLRFPMIVKHPHGYASAGMTRDSRVTDEGGLHRETERIIQAYGAALIEEFIEGREFTVLVTEPRDGSEEAWVFEPVEFCFPPGERFKHFDLKWKDYALMETRPVTDAGLAARLREASALTFAGLEGSGYARCDLRVDEAGEAYLLEINPNCGVFYPEGSFGSADFILAADAAGHRGFLLHLIDCAIRRRDRERNAWSLDFNPATGFGMIAARSLQAGEVAVRYEERAQRLVSRGHVERNWRGMRRRWFDGYAWPIAGDVHGMWSSDPGEWRPINHACDPNTWFEGLDLVARRDIGAGDELTVDYATFCGPDMQPFECRCGSEECRRVILGSDLQLPEIAQRYGAHRSPFLRSSPERQMLFEERPMLFEKQKLPFEMVRNGVGIGVIARRAFACGESLSPIRWSERKAMPSRWTLQLEAGEHAEPSPFELRFVNHSCSPNVIFDVDASSLRAVRAIDPGEELRCFYPATEWQIAEIFECRCGAAECLGSIAGASQIDRAILRHYELSGFVREQVNGGSGS
jgi:D-alanine-D-alanine ligase